MSVKNKFHIVLLSAAVTVFPAVASASLGPPDPLVVFSVRFYFMLGCFVLLLLILLAIYLIKYFKQQDQEQKIIIKSKLRYIIVGLVVILLVSIAFDLYLYFTKYRTFFLTYCSHATYCFPPYIEWLTSMSYMRGLFFWVTIPGYLLRLIF